MKAKYFDTMPARAKDFLNYQSIIKNRSATTVEQYCLDLRLFFKFMFCKLNNISSALIEKEDVTMDISVFDDNFYNTVNLGDS